MNTSDFDKPAVCDMIARKVSLRSNERLNKLINDYELNVPCDINGYNEIVEHLVRLNPYYHAITCRPIYGYTDYSFIDSMCRRMIRFFNKSGLKTKVCCQGHDKDGHRRFFIWFADTELTNKLFINYKSDYLIMRENGLHFIVENDNVGEIHRIAKEEYEKMKMFIIKNLI